MWPVRQLLVTGMGGKTESGEDVLLLDLFSLRG